MTVLAKKIKVGKVEKSRLWKEDDLKRCGHVRVTCHLFSRTYGLTGVTTRQGEGGAKI